MGMDVRRLKAHLLGPQGGPLRVVYRAATVAQLAGVRALDRLGAVQGGRVDAGERAESARRVTVIAKTFERPKVADRLVRTLRRVFDGRILIADDSRTPMTSTDALVDVIPLPFNSGVAIGRNAALDAVDTDYVLVTDDDIVFTAGSDIDAARRHLDEHPEIDMIGFLLVEVPRWRAIDTGPDALFPGHREPLRRWGELVGGLPVRYKIAQVYLARTEAVRRVRWDPAIRMVDHRDFFSRAAGEIVVVVAQSIRAYHARTPFDAHYTSYRDDTAADLRYLGRVWYGQGESPRQE
ncbi:MAG: glycosyltransferase family A protein [Ornithinibacter sp.]